MVFTIRGFEFNHWKVLVRDWAGIGTLQDSPEETLRAGNQLSNHPETEAIKRFNAPFRV